MAKIPSELGVKFSVSDITMEVPKPLFEHAAIKVAIFFGRKGKGSLTRRTKWFTLADPSLVGSSTRQMLVLPPQEDRMEGSRRGSTTKTGADSQETSLRQVTGELAVIEFGGLNNIAYETELKPLNKFDGEWVFDQKLTHPLTVFAKVFIKPRRGAKGNIAKSEQESNLNEMLQMDQSELDEDDFSGEDQDGAVDANERSLNIEGVHLTTEQLALLTDGRNENDILIEQLKNERDCKKRYVAFPKTIDLGTVANTRAKVLEFSERLNCKSASLLGSVISFKVHAEVDEGTLAEYESKKKDKEDKEERKRREKEEKILEKDRKKQEKADSKKKKGEKSEATYGTDVTEGRGAAATTTEVSKTAPPQTTDKQKGGFSPFSKIKGIFGGKDKPQTTPFPLKFDHTPYPYLFLLDKFVLHKLTMPHDFYRAVHVRMGCDSADIDGFPMLMLTTDNKSFLKEADVPTYDGTMKHVFKFDFGNSHMYFADKHIRNITGFDTIRAITERENEYAKAKKRAAEGVEATEKDKQAQTTNLFRSEILGTGEKFQPVTFQATKYSANDAQVESTKFTRITAQLVVPKRVENWTIVTDDEEKEAYLKKIKKEQKDKEKEQKEKEKEEKAREKREKKEEKKRRKAEKKAAKAKAGEAASSSDEETSDEEGEEHKEGEEGEENKNSDSDSDSDVPKQATEHVSPNEGQEGSEGAKETAFESEGADEQGKKPAEPKEPKASKESRFSLNKTRSFQLGPHLVNEENIPPSGITYAIRFVTGEELTFRARRVFLPSMCIYGDNGASKNDVPLLKFSPTS